MKRKLSLAAYDERYLQFWLAGARNATLVAEVDEGLRETDPQTYRALTAQLVRFSQDLHACRVAAVTEKAPGHEMTESAILRVTRDSAGRVIRLVIEPRFLRNETLLGANAPVPIVKANLPVALPVDDLLNEVFGAPPDAEKTPLDS